MILGLPIEEFGDGRGLALVGVAGGNLPDGNEAVRGIVRQRAVEQSVHDAEDGAVSADAHGERKDHGQDEARIFAQGTSGIEEVLNEVSKPRSRAHVRVPPKREV
jgi:hypothetical protein